MKDQKNKIKKPFVRIAADKAKKDPKKAKTKVKAKSPDISDEDTISNHEDDKEYESEVILEDSEILPAVMDEEELDDDADKDLDEIFDSALDKLDGKEPGLVKFNPLQRYLAELRKYSLMNREEEKEVAIRAYEQNDLEARNRLVTANLRLVVKIAMEYRRAYTQILDLIQEGNAGLVQAVNRFNPYRGVKLSTYSAWWIRAYILKFLMDNKSLVRMGTTDAQRKLFFRLRGEAEKLYALTQKFDANLLAERIGVQAQDVLDMQERLTKNDLSLDAPVSEETDTRQVDLLSADAEDPDLSYEKEQLLKILRNQVSFVEKELNDRDKYILHQRILADEPVTLQDVGDKFGITRERARQLEARVIKKIKDKIIASGMLG